MKKFGMFRKIYLIEFFGNSIDECPEFGKFFFPNEKDNISNEYVIIKKNSEGSVHSIDVIGGNGEQYNHFVLLSEMKYNPEQYANNIIEEVLKYLQTNIKIMQQRYNLIKFS